jgi:succinate-semialdehyde dehydrogenase/glutarate-semialdehyde dehydrogenase
MLQAGNGMDAGVTICLLIDHQSIDKMQRQVADARAKGAKVLIGRERLMAGGLDRGQFCAPTVMVNVIREMDIYYEETFGPVSPVIVFDDQDEVVAMANDTPYGLAAHL